MTSINVNAQKRLLKKDIFCLNANFINSCGIIDATVFDKTGTLTEDSLDFASILPSLYNSISNNLIEKFVRNKNQKDENLNEIKNLDRHQSLKEGSDFSLEPWIELKDKELNNLIMTVGCCHSLIFFDNKIDGDVLDLKMFEQLNWKITNDKKEIDELSINFPDLFNLERIIKTDIKLSPTELINGEKINSEHQLIVGIVKEFQFESALQRMMVIVKPILYSGDNQSNLLNNNNYLVLVKGNIKFLYAIFIKKNIEDLFLICNKL